MKKEVGVLFKCDCVSLLYIDAYNNKFGKKKKKKFWNVGHKSQHQQWYMIYAFPVHDHHIYKKIIVIMEYAYVESQDK